MKHSEHPVISFAQEHFAAIYEEASRQERMNRQLWLHHIGLIQKWRAEQNA